MPTTQTEIAKAPARARAESTPRRSAAGIALLYVLLAGAWVVFSDLLLLALFDDAAWIAAAQLYKGIFLVLGTGAWLYTLSVRESRLSARESPLSVREPRDLHTVSTGELDDESGGDLITTDRSNLAVTDRSNLTAAGRSDWERAEARLRQQLERIASLRAIDLAITGSVDLRVTLHVLLDQVTVRLQVDAAAVLLFNPETQRLEFAAGRGFRGTAIREISPQLGEGNAGRAALERRMLELVDVRRDPGAAITQRLSADEGFVHYCAAPLIAKGRLQGVLEVFHRSSVERDPEWRDYLEALAGQAAIAVDNASLFEALERSNTELALAYDTTLEGWARTLELRDHETEGHSRRVTEMTLRLARAVGIRQDELVHVRRGALLHDIGKIAIPDRVLLKAGPLDDDEWELMRRHPVYAYELLSPIAYLRPALDIPYAHHERWDGSGYPRGLRAEEIPLPARVFAVVDAWDAMRSNRPYREAMPVTVAREQIRIGAGSHFDPRIAGAFLELVDNSG